MYPVAPTKLEIVSWADLLPCLGCGIEGPDSINILIEDDVVQCCGSVPIGKGGVANHVPAWVDGDGLINSGLCAIV